MTRNFYQAAVQQMWHEKSFAPMVRARCTIGFNAQEERHYQNIKHMYRRDAPGAHAPYRMTAEEREAAGSKAWGTCMTIEDRWRQARYAADPFNMDRRSRCRGIVGAWKYVVGPPVTDSSGFVSTSSKAIRDGDGDRTYWEIFMAGEGPQGTRES
jgi:hypothetical protein